MTRRLHVTYSPKHSLHAPPLQYFEGQATAHPEQPIRVERILEALQSAPLALDLHIVTESPELEQLASTHAPDYLAHLQSMSAHAETQNGSYFNASVFPVRRHMARLEQSTVGKPGYYCYDSLGFFTSTTWEAATGAAACALSGAHMLRTGTSKVVYSLCRPPGHHAGSDFCGGYCYLNNAALAARALSMDGKVAVLDLDYHHGNGTQEIFWEDGAVWTGSIHADPDLEYPYYSGYADERGGGRGRGLNLNSPLPLGVGDGQYLDVLEHQLETLVDFAPQWVVVSLGFDTYGKDPEGGFDLTGDGFTQIGRRLSQVGLPLIVVQEGGYIVEAIGDLSLRFFGGLLR